jgi:two-component system nitrogen regulation response regulator GlnG
MTKGERVWVIDDDRSIRWVLERALEQAGMDVSTFADANGIMEQLARGHPDALITDIRMPGLSGLELLSTLQREHPQLPVIVMTAHSDLDSAVSAFHRGAFEYLPKPFDVDDAVDLVRKACGHARSERREPEGRGVTSFPEIIGEAPAMQEVFRAIGRLARSSITVLINGESGTGKELVARALHRHSPRASGPFVALNMAAIPRELMESELFGHERGAFTGAQTRRVGRFEQAEGGTLFLDEIGDMPAELQTRLLRVLSDGEFYRVGGHVPVHADVRIIAATHQDLERSVQTGEFREDLFHRLNVIRVHIPALRRRREDIPALLDYFLARTALELNVEAKTLLPEAQRLLISLNWPGNVRQLENTCRWLTVMAPGQAVHLEDIPSELRGALAQTTPAPADDWETSLGRWAADQLKAGRTKLLDDAEPRFERTLILVALQFTGGRKQDAAKLLGWGRNTLTRKMHELQMD